MDWNPAHWVLVCDGSSYPCPLLASACAHCPTPFLVLVPFRLSSISKDKGTNTHDDHKEILPNWGHGLHSPGAWVSWAGHWEVLGVLASKAQGEALSMVFKSPAWESIRPGFFTPPLCNHGRV